MALGPQAVDPVEHAISEEARARAVGVEAVGHQPQPHLRARARVGDSEGRAAVREADAASAEGGLPGRDMVAGTSREAGGKRVRACEGSEERVARVGSPAAGAGCARAPRSRGRPAS